MSRRSSIGLSALCFVYFLGVGFGHSVAEPADGGASPAAPAVEVPSFWATDYATAMATVEQEAKMLVLYFADSAGSDLCRRFEAGPLADPAVLATLRTAVTVKLPLDAQIQVQGQPARLLEHPAYRVLEGRAGIVCIDLAHKESRLNGRVVSGFPLEEGRQYTAQDFAALLNPADPAQAIQSVASAPPEPWLTNYEDATEIAQREGKMLLVYFAGSDPRCTQFENQVLTDPRINEKLREYVRVKLPMDATIPMGEQTVELLKHRAFAEMMETPGLAILDFAHKDAPYYKCVVSTFPFLPSLSYTSREMAVILDLPPGTLTQRTLIFAVRIHPERPASANGRLDPTLLREAQGSADYQAAIGRQGHHFWETRFHRINRFLPFGLMASEVCAESWPGQGLLQAAIECVRCWRTSAGHWGAVSESHQVFGYDMKRGANGIWYAAGVFGRASRH